ncbi:hypothetical protein [Haloarcula laminariae]|uniref:hypothetical protein n=1 Tax=Haloarcula laminariae TaxID=2961577 RepID=UPI0021C61CE3|nr:hypothetical protein [Halomicroarcula laminariae]
MPKEHGNSGEFVETVTLADVLDTFDAVEGPVILSADVADRLDCSRQTARRKLQQLYDRGDVDRRKVSRRVVYWRTEDADRSRPTPDQSPTNSDAVDGEVRGSVDSSLADDHTDGDGDVTLPSEISDEIRDAVEDAAERWEDDARLPNRKQAAATVLQYAVDTGDPVGKSHPVVDAVRETFPVDGQKRETYWRQNLRDGILKAHGEYSKANHGYNVEGVGSDQ